MGLDNGIIMITPDKQYPKWIKDVCNGEGEVCYWRKCWGIREVILKVLDPKGIKQNESDCENYIIEAEDIPAIIKALKPFFSKEYWEENADSIWEFDEIFPRLIEQILNLERLKEYLEKNKDIIVYFYDSY